MVGAPIVTDVLQFENNVLNSVKKIEARAPTVS